MKKLILLLFTVLVFGCSISKEEMEIVINKEITKTVEKDKNLSIFYLGIDSIKNLKKPKKRFFGSLELIDERITDLSKIEYNSEKLFFEGEISNDSIYYNISGKYRFWEVKKFLTDFYDIKYNKLKNNDYETTLEKYVDYKTLEYFYHYEIKDSSGKLIFNGSSIHTN
tara:strand:+ start:224 stop:727 length:504 start_codon:yes stop_codon:yes gene_type:complete